MRRPLKRISGCSSGFLPSLRLRRESLVFPPGSPRMKSGTRLKHTSLETSVEKLTSSKARTFLSDPVPVFSIFIDRCVLNEFPRFLRHYKVSLGCLVVLSYIVLNSSVLLLARLPVNRDSRVGDRARLLGAGRSILEAFKQLIDRSIVNSIGPSTKSHL